MPRGLAPDAVGHRVGTVGDPTANTLTLFGHISQTGGWSMLATLPVAAWELSVGFYMTFKGFRSTPLTAAVA